MAVESGLEKDWGKSLKNSNSVLISLWKMLVSTQLSRINSHIVK